MYQFQEFPKWVYSEIKKEMVIVKDAVEELFHSKEKADSPPEPVVHTETMAEILAAQDEARTTKRK